MKLLHCKLREIERPFWEQQISNKSSPAPLSIVGICGLSYVASTSCSAAQCGKHLKWQPFKVLFSPPRRRLDACPKLIGQSAGGGAKFLGTQTLGRDPNNSKMTLAVSSSTRAQNHLSQWWSKIQQNFPIFTSAGAINEPLKTSIAQGKMRQVRF